MQFFGVPKASVDTWTKIVSTINGHGTKIKFVCEKHFLPQNIIKNYAGEVKDINFPNRARFSLVKGAIPQLPQQNVEKHNECNFSVIEKLKNSNNGDIVKSTEQGTISFQFKNGISVDITLDGSIRVANQTANAVAAVNATGTISALMHPVGFMYTKDEIVHVQANDIHFGNHKLAKIRSTGIHFKAIQSPLVYLVDEAGVRTNFSENFMRMDRDITLDVLYKDCRHGAMYVNVCNDLLSDIESTVLETGTEWKFYDVSVIQENIHGFVRVIKYGRDKFEIRSSASVGTINLYSDVVDCTASHGTNHHFFVKKSKSRIHYEVHNKFMVRYGGYHTGFNECDEVSFF